MGEDEDRPRVFDDQRRINQQADGDKEDRAEHIAHRVHDGLDAGDLPRFRDDRTDDEGPQRHTEADFHREEQHAEAEADHGDEQGLVAAGFAT